MTMEHTTAMILIKLNDRIEEAKSLHQAAAEEWPSEAYKNAISWEEFFMGIAILSTSRPGKHDRKQEKAVKFEKTIDYFQLYM